MKTSSAKRRSKAKIYCRHTGIWTLGKFKPNPGNPNTHPPEQIEKLRDIILANGWRMPITVSDRSGLITKGHGRLEAAILGRLKEAPYEIQHYASDEQEWADVIADNRLPELGETDDARMAVALKELRKTELDFKATGYDEAEFQELLAQLRIGTTTQGKATDSSPGPQAEGRFTVILHYTEGEHEEFVRLSAETMKRLDLLTTSDTILRLLCRAAK